MSLFPFFRLAEVRGKAMGFLARCDDPFTLEVLAARIRKSSNFRFSWQFYHSGGIDLRSPSAVADALGVIIATADLHRFLKESFEPMCDAVFEIEPLHEHCRIAASTDQFENILASAAGDHLGAYSRVLRPANADEKQEVRDLFGCPGSYCTFQLLPGNVPDCSICSTHNSHLFTSWFDGVAWDWCLFASWPSRELFWMGCLTDTD